MTLCTLIADEITAAGFRLAGVAVEVPEPAQLAPLFQRLLGTSELLLVTAEQAARLPAGDLEAALARGRPLLLVIPDVRGAVSPPDLGQRLRRQLGLAE
jgi:vacuolar-type H+-ATPase subunit F/Vma7